MFIDIHSHVLPGVDDGANTLDNALKMLRIAESIGVRAVAATPHLLDSTLTEATILSRYRELESAVQEQRIGVDVYLGSEVMFQFGMEDIISGPIGTYRGMGRYFLVESGMNYLQRRFGPVLGELADAGVTPVMAHPERIAPLTGDIDRAAELRGQGILFQVNTSSLLGIFGGRIRDFAWELLEKGYVHCIASDAHTTRNRTFNQDQVWELVRKRFTEDFADVIMMVNPGKVLFGEPVVNPADL